MFENLKLEINDAGMLEKLQYAGDEIYSLWSDIKFDEAAKIRNSWADEAGKIYIDKLLEVNNTVNKALNLINDFRENLQSCIRKIEEDEELRQKLNIYNNSNNLYRYNEFGED